MSPVRSAKVITVSEVDFARDSGIVTIVAMVASRSMLGAMSAGMATFVLLRALF